MKLFNYTRGHDVYKRVHYNCSPLGSELWCIRKCEPGLRPVKDTLPILLSHLKPVVWLTRAEYTTVDNRLDADRMTSLRYPAQKRVLVLRPVSSRAARFRRNQAAIACDVDASLQTEFARGNFVDDLVSGTFPESNDVPVVAGRAEADLTRLGDFTDFDVLDRERKKACALERFVCQCY